LADFRIVTRLTAVIPIALVCLASILPFISTIHSYFLADDFGVVQLLARVDTFHVLSLFTSPWTDHIYGDVADELRPTVALAFQFSSQWGIASPPAYHIVNITVHVLNSLLVFAIARFVAKLPLPASTFSASLFAVLPIHSETLGWLQGLSDSVPAFFYLASFLVYASWRRFGRLWLYCGACVLFLLALFSKQSAITMLLTLIAYDVLVERRHLRMSPTAAGPYIIFLCLTVSYLVERYILFGNIARENMVSPSSIKWLILYFGSIQVTALQMLLLGAPALWSEDVSRFGRVFQWLWSGVGIGAASIAVILACFPLWRAARGRIGPTQLMASFFGPVWWLISTIPLVVTYESPRHLYLLSVGLSITLGLGLNELLKRQRRLWSEAILCGGVLVVLISIFMLQRPLGEWNKAAAISAKIMSEVEHEAVSNPAGTLLLLGPPNKSAPAGGWKDRIWLWYWALPFATEPPYTQRELRDRVHLIYPPSVYCCGNSHGRQQWLTDTKQAVAAWLGEPNRAPGLVLVWDASTGALIKRSDEREKDLREQLVSLLDSPTVEDMESRLALILGRPEE
jgi:hypothetical protein